jgi:hypothetical protein
LNSSYLVPWYLIFRLHFGNPFQIYSSTNLQHYKEEVTCHLTSINSTEVFKLFLNIVGLGKRLNTIFRIGKLVLDSVFRLNEAAYSPDSATWLFYPETHAHPLSLLRFPYIFLICNQDSSESIFVLFKERDSSYSPSLLRSSYNLIFHSVSLHYRIKQTRFKVLCKKKTRF